MKFSERWLRTFADPQISTEQLARALTMAGLEVEEVAPAAPAFSMVVVGRVVEVSAHPNAERLSVCKVDAGSGSVLEVVCGAPNVARGVVAPCALVGAKLPGMQIEETKLRGVTSQGMLCSAAELGISDDSSGLLLLPQDAPIGKDFRRYYELDDQIFTLKLTSNRGDCLSLLGIAREVSAITGTPLKLPKDVPVAASLTDAIQVTLSAPDLCPRYAGRILRGLDTRASTPASIVRRLERSGVRAISAVVDLTNYVMLELGQPMHAFDLDKLNGRIDVRLAHASERLELLNGQTINLEPDMLLICDASGPIALAGIMGGAPTGVSDSTRNIFLESAFFSPKAIAGKWRRLGFSSDAMHRFERGVDYEGSARAVERLTQLILETCGGKPGPVSDTKAALPDRKEVHVRVSRAQRVLGMPVTAEKVAEVLQRLQMPARRLDDAFAVTPPSYRFDIAIEEDLIEEIARLDGYDKLPATLPKTQATMLADPECVPGAARIRHLMIARDYQEIVTYSFVDESWERDFAANDRPIRLANPIAAHMSVMRSTLLGSLVDCLRFNINRKQSRIRVFEVSRCFGVDGSGIEQPQRVGALAYGAAAPEQWGLPNRQVDYFDMRGDIEALCAPVTPEFRPCARPALHPGKSAEVFCGGESAGWVGELHPRLRQKYDLAGTVVAFELNLDIIAARPLPAYREFSRFPLVRRDLSYVFDREIPVQAILDGLNNRKSAIVDEVCVFDVYYGKGIEEGKKGLAFRVLLQDTQKTLTDAEVDVAVARLREVLEKEYGAKLRQ